MSRGFRVAIVSVLVFGATACGDPDDSASVSEPTIPTSEAERITSVSNTQAASTTATSTTTSMAPERRLDTAERAEPLEIDQANAVAIGESGEMAIATGDGTLAIWADGSTGSPELVDTGSDALIDVAIASDGSVVTVNSAGIANRWVDDSGEWSIAWTVIGDELGESRAVAISPDGRTIATGGIDQVVRRWDASDDSAAPTQINVDEPIVDLAFAPDGAELAVLLVSGQVLTVGDVADAASTAGTANPLGRALIYDGDGALHVSGAKMLTSLDDKETAPTAKFDGGVFALSYRSDKAAPALIAAAGLRGSMPAITVWDPDAPERPLEVGGLIDEPTAVALGPSGSYVVFADYQQAYRQRLVNR